MEFTKINLKGRISTGAIVTGTYVSNDSKWIVQHLQAPNGWDLGIRYGRLTSAKLSEIDWDIYTSSTLKRVFEIINERFYKNQKTA